MDFTLSDEQQLLKDSVQGFLRGRYPFERRFARRGQPVSRDIWTALAGDLGITAVGVPEDLGGIGGDGVETMIVMEELGRALVVEPYLETVAIAVPALVADGGAHARAVLERIVAGEAICAFAWGEAGLRNRIADVAVTARQDGDGWRLDGSKAVVTAAPWADHLLVLARTAGKPGDREGLSLFLVDSVLDGISQRAYPTVDGRDAADIEFAHVALPGHALLGAEGQAADLAEELLDRAIAAICAEAVGLMEQMLAYTRAYLLERRQFGQPLASFQVLQHRLVDMYMQVEMARSATYLATLKLGAAPAERMRAASAAKVTIGSACRFVGQNAVQLFGGMGVTDEAAVSHYFRRSTCIESEFGAIDYHLSRHVALGKGTAQATGTREAAASDSLIPA